MSIVFQKLCIADCRETGDLDDPVSDVYKNHAFALRWPNETAAAQREIGKFPGQRRGLEAGTLFVLRNRKK